MFHCLTISDAPIWNLADILITDTGSEISATIPIADVIIGATSLTMQALMLTQASK